MRSIQQENSEPENIAIGQVSKKLRYLQRHSQYVSEIERVLKELRLTVSLIAEAKQSKINESLGVSKQEVLVYYQGIFLTLVHQIKDKVVQLLNLMTEEGIPDKPTEEKDVSVSVLLRNKEEVIRKIGIEAEVREWEQENPTSKIAVALRKRTPYHHRVSGLQRNPDFLNLGFTDLAIHPEFQEKLSEYGKQQIEKMRAESTARLFADAETKAKNTLVAIEENIEKVSLALVHYFKLPVAEEEATQIIDGYTKMLEGFDVNNVSSLEKVSEHHKRFLETFITDVDKELPGVIEAVYLVGSLSRGEYEEDYSDVNLYIILSGDKLPEEIVEVEKVQKLTPHSRNLDIKFFSKRGFQSEKSRKYRMIVQADGVLLYGTDLVRGEKMPNAGLFMSLTLNEDILNVIDEAEKWMQENPDATALEISRRSRKIAKRILDFFYGVVVSNKPQYTSSRAERIVRMNEMYPQNRETIETLVGVSRYGVGELESFKNLLEGFRPKAEKILAHMLEVKKGIDSQETRTNQEK